jgi:hypothetical protein
VTHLGGEDGASSVSGLQNVVLGLKYQLIRSEATETVMSVGLGWEIGGTGRTAVGAERIDTITPSILLGKGLGDLPGAMALARPLAAAVLVQLIAPTAAQTRTSGTIESHPNSIRWGLVVEYSAPSLQSYVRDLGIPAPLNRMVPIVEIERQTFVDRGARGTGHERRHREPRGRVDRQPRSGRCRGRHPLETSGRAPTSASGPSCASVSTSSSVTLR